MIESRADMEDDEGRQCEGTPDVDREQDMGQGFVRAIRAGKSKSP